MNKGFFVRWYTKRGRSFPWRAPTTTKFELLVTEMLLRQTRAANVEKIWHGFVRRYPTAETMIRASRKELSSQLEVLGFGNQKAEALLSAAHWLISRHGGEVPDRLEELLDIPHIGLYSARAILSFAYGHRIEIVDTNIQRLFARYHGLEVKPDIRRNPIIWKMATEALPRSRKQAMHHNYGLLDFTAEVCKAGRPRCTICPIAAKCATGGELIEKGTAASGKPGNR